MAWVASTRCAGDALDALQRASLFATDCATGPSAEAHTGGARAAFGETMAEPIGNGSMRSAVVGA